MSPENIFFVIMVVCLTLLVLYKMYKKISSDLEPRFRIGVFKNGQLEYEYFYSENSASSTLKYYKNHGRVAWLEDKYQKLE